MKKFDQINIIPFVDIMLVLLAIVLMTASFIAKDKIKVSIPNSNSNIKLNSTDIIGLITITEAGDIYKDKEKITISQLDKELSVWQKSKSITLKVDSNAKFQSFVDVTSLLNTYGLKKLSIATIKKDK